MKKKKFMGMVLIVVCMMTFSNTQALTEEKDTVYKEISEILANLQNKCPEVAKGFQVLHKSIMEEGKLGRKEKELIALGIAVGLRCHYCIYAHTASAMEFGATEDEIMEAASVAILMSGGPGVAYTKYVTDALEALKIMKKGKDAKKQQ